MQHVIEVQVRNKRAYAEGNPVYICGNADYIVHFDFDEEWNAHASKTARFIVDDGSYYDVVFTGETCALPVLSDTWGISVGVYAGNLRTTTAARIDAKKSILCNGGMPAAPMDDVYAQIMAKLDEVAVGGGVTPEQVQEAVDAALQAAKDSGEFDGEPGEKGDKGDKGDPGEPGKDGDPGKTPVRGVDYWTDADKEQIVDEVLGEVDAPYELISLVEINEPVAQVKMDGFKLKEFLLTVYLPGGDTAASLAGTVYTEGGDSLYFGIGNALVANAERYTKLHVSIKNNLLRLRSGQPSVKITDSTSNGVTGYVVTSGYINKVQPYMGSSQKFPKGSWLKLEGVRANA